MCSAQLCLYLATYSTTTMPCSLRYLLCPGYFRKGEVLATTQSFGEAVRAFEVAARLDPSDATLALRLQEARTRQATLASGTSVVGRGRAKYRSEQLSSHHHRNHHLPVSLVCSWRVARNNHATVAVCTLCCNPRRIDGSSYSRARGPREQTCVWLVWGFD